MSEKVRKIAVSILLAVFALFVSADTLCLHTHVTDGGIVTHSHPYLPSSHHTHTSAQFAGIALVNALLFNDSGCSTTISFSDTLSELTISPTTLLVKPIPAHLSGYPRRGPPEPIA